MADSDRTGRTRPLASSPCFLAEAEGAVDPAQAIEVARWRKAERVRLLDARRALPVETRRDMAARIARHLDAALGDAAGRVVSGYWPIKSELDLRFWLTDLVRRGATVALPVVEERAQPLVFRAWIPGAPMARGFWNIPVPAEGAALRPDVALAPLVGFDGAGYRLGYGGGYFDRTLAALAPRPLVIGVGPALARIATIFPQPHDIPMDMIVTEEGRAPAPEDGGAG